MDCKVKVELDRKGSAGICDERIISEIVESIGQVHHGSVEIKIQDSRVVQIDTLEKRRLK
ncbi:MAG: YezD family protein [Nitrospirae bacterium]|nr:YezD family protein [Nitrospirota bacterium]